MSTVGAAEAAPTSTPAAGLSAQEQQLLNSDTPKTVELDPATGRVLSVEKGTAGLSKLPSISNHNICNTGEGCFLSGQIPYAHQGFWGSAGTFTGNWPSRSGYFTGDYTAGACWAGACSQQPLGPNTTASFGGTLVTGTSFTIY
ncbi:hypothetical protein AB0C52_05170 [Streptomyces sp. NPDC048717]|uniref:hypothetical protein n=1 Tax=unclassified Streptomyces TaxID=2593676 RepID=UPI00342A8D31